MKENLYDILNIDKNTTKEEIKKAYKKMAKKYHPDKIGGDEEKIKEINKAYLILYNEITRTEYDETGETEGKQDSDLISSLCQLFIIVLEKTGGDDSNLIQIMRDEIQKKIISGEREIDISEKAIEKFKKIKKRVKKKKEGFLYNAIISTIERNIESSKNQKNKKEREIENYKKMKELLYEIDYEYKPNPRGEDCSMNDNQRHYERLLNRMFCAYS